MAQEKMPLLPPPEVIEEELEKLRGKKNKKGDTREQPTVEAPEYREPPRESDQEPDKRGVIEFDMGEGKK